MSVYTYEITERPSDVGGGWRLKLLHDGVEVGGAIHPAADIEHHIDGYNDLLDEAHAWLESRSDKGANDISSAGWQKSIETVQMVYADSEVALQAIDYLVAMAAFSHERDQPVGLSQAATDVLAERTRQQSDERWTEKHDDRYQEPLLARAAAAYADPRTAWLVVDRQPLWPFDHEFFKPKDHRRNCVRAAALLLAEIERIDRSAAFTASTDEPN